MEPGIFAGCATNRGAIFGKRTSLKRTTAIDDNLVFDISMKQLREYPEVYIHCNGNHDVSLNVENAAPEMFITHYRLHGIY